MATLLAFNRKHNAKDGHPYIIINIDDYKLAPVAEKNMFCIIDFELGETLLEQLAENEQDSENIVISDYETEGNINVFTFLNFPKNHYDKMFKLASWRYAS